MNGRATAALGAVLFDMDGLLIDSERLWLDVEREVMSRLGAPWHEADQAALVGGSLERTVSFMVARSPRAVSPDMVRRWLLDGMVDRLGAGVSLCPGAGALLDEVTARDVPRALVSSAHRVLVDAALGHIGRDRFSVVVAGDEVRHTKPHPEPYRTAARLLGADAGSCVALEDSPNGLASAEAAGCVAVAVPGVVPIEPGPNRVVVRSLAELDVARLESLVAARRDGRWRGRA